MENLCEISKWATFFLWLNIMLNIALTIFNIKILRQNNSAVQVANRIKGEDKGRDW